MREAEQAILRGVGNCTLGHGVHVRADDTRCESSSPSIDIGLLRALVGLQWSWKTPIP